MIEVVVLILLLLVAVALVIVSIWYRVQEIREDEAVWDALIARTRRGGER